MDKNKLRTIAYHYGINTQIVQTMEECSELILALSKYMRYKNVVRPFSVEEEIADVRIMLEQIQYLLGFDEKEISMIEDIKIYRQLERIENEE